MLSRYSSILCTLTLLEETTLRRALALDPSLPLVAALQARRHDQADIVLTLLHAGHHDAVARLMGRPIIVFSAQPSQFEAWRRHSRSLEQAEGEPELGDQRLIRVSVPVCPLIIPTAQQRWKLMTACRTVQSYLSRVPRWRGLRDLREWSQRGWLVLEA